MLLDTPNKEVLEPSADGEPSADRKPTANKTPTPVEGKQGSTPSPNAPLRVLVLCTGNSARSIMAEAVLNTIGAPLFQAYSAGSNPTGKVNPLALEQIDQLNLTTPSTIRSKNWHEFSLPDAVELDLILTVCSNAAAETCPNFAGNATRIHWGFPDPAGCSPDIQQEREAFAQCFNTLKSRVHTLVDSLSIMDSRETVASAMRKLA